MKSLTLFALVLSALPITAGATSGICTVANVDEPMLPKTIAWDTSTRVAKATFLVEGSIVGRVARVETGGSGREVVTLSFPSIPKPWDDDEWQFVIHEPSKSKFVIMGVGLDHVGGDKLLSSMKGLSDATCEKL